MSSLLLFLLAMPMVCVCVVGIQLPIYIYLCHVPLFFDNNNCGGSVAATAVPGRVCWGDIRASARGQFTLNSFASK